MEEDFQLDEKIAGLVKKSKKSKVPYGILKKVYNRGMVSHGEQDIDLALHHNSGRLQESTHS